MKSVWLSFLILQPALSTAPPRSCVEQSRTRWRVLFFCAIFSSLLSGVAGAAALRLVWQDKSNNESGFKIERLDGSSYVSIASLAANVVSYTDSNLAAGRTYCYRVRSYNGGGASAPTNAACTTTPVTSAAPTPSPSTPPPNGTTFPTNPASTPSPVAPTGKPWSDYLVSMKIRSADNDAVDGNLSGWKAFDDAGTTSGPSIWSVVNGALVQGSNIGSDATGHPGTFLLY